MAPIDESEIVRVANEIERYIRSHPAAMDSIEGICQWWLPQQRYYEAVAMVEKALNYLVVQGRIGKETRSHGPALYAFRRTVDDKKKV